MGPQGEGLPWREGHAEVQGLEMLVGGAQPPLLLPRQSMALIGDGGGLTDQRGRGRPTLRQGHQFEGGGIAVGALHPHPLG